MFSYLIPTAVWVLNSYGEWSQKYVHELSLFLPKMATNSLHSLGQRWSLCQRPKLSSSIII